MRILVRNHFDNAFEALRANRLRTALTVMGVVIGTACIAAVLSLSHGATRFFDHQVMIVHDSVALVRPAPPPATSLTGAGSLAGASMLTEKDAHSLAQLEHAVAAPMAIMRSGMRANDGSVDAKHATILGTTAEIMTIAGLTMLDGQFFPDNTSISGIIVGKQLAIDMFGTEYALGNIITIRGETFTVMGILESTDQPVYYLGVDFERTAIVTTSAMKRFTEGVLHIQQIALMSQEDGRLDDVVKQTTHALKENHKGEQDFSILTGADIAAPNNELLKSVTAIVSVVAGISLLVGGIGIMNIMLVNVAERHREVGIRKAIGAANGHIINQFLIESIIVGLTGGVIGYGLGVGSAFLIGMYLPFMPMVEWQVAAISIGVAIGTGIVFGLYPALHAAQKDPITALRQ